MAAVFNLNHHATYLDFHIGKSDSPFFLFHLSLSNVILIGLMFVVFFAAIFLPFPGSRSGTES